MSNLARFSNIYPVSKTLRFELLPQGETLQNIQKNGLLSQDKKKANDYQNVKKLIDRYHKFFIDDVLSKISFDWTELENAITEYRKDKTQQEQLETVQKKMREKIAKAFSSDKRFSELTASTPEKLLKNAEFLSLLDSSEKATIKSFDKFSSYFTGFQENRKNVYSAEEISTSVPYRIVHDNFPKFLQNVTSYNELKNICPEVLKKATAELKDVLNGKSLDEVFSVSAFNKVLSQKGIDFYNQIIGGVSGKNETKKVRGVNECVNQYWQQNADFSKEHKQIKMTPLFKQIMSDRSTLSFVIETIESDKDLCAALENFQNDAKTSFEKISELHKKLQNANNETLFNIFVNAKDLTFVSEVLFGKWDEIQKRMNAYAKTNFTKKEQVRWVNESVADAASGTESVKQKKGEFSFAELNSALSFYSDEIEATDVRMQNYFDFPLWQNGSDKKIRFDSASDFKNKENEKYNFMARFLSAIKNGDFIKDNKDAVQAIKDYLDYVQNCYHRLKPLDVSNEAERDSDFYELFDEITENLSLVIPLYNKTRNYVTKKPNNQGKYKLNFENAQLAKGWDEDVEKAKASVILIKDKKYYLGIINAKNKVKFSDAPVQNGNEPCYKKMIYKQFDALKQIPKCSTQLKEVKKHFELGAEEAYTLNDKKNFLKNLVITKKIWELNNYVWDGSKFVLKKDGDTRPKKFQIGYIRQTGDEKGYRDALASWISFCKDFLVSYKSSAIYEYNFKESTEYKALDEFVNYLSNCCYKITFCDVPAKTVEKWVSENRLYLFQIYNKDFASGAKGKPNLHTLYWETVFSEENLRDVVFKLNGEAELFYRDTVIKNAFSHNVGEKMVNRATSNGKTLSESAHKELVDFENGRIQKNDLSSEAKTILESGTLIVKNVTHKITKDRHYTEPKFLFHAPLTINFKASGNDKTLNLQAREFLKGNGDVKIIGLDRGERNLIYMTMIDRDGKIVMQKSFNQISAGKRKVDYHEKLDTREKERDAARKSWQAVGKIAELKEGYLSAVIYEIASLMARHNAIVVMEDLNFGFKRGRFHVEKQVYQKFEKMLIDKLNYFAFKDDVLHGTQLTQMFTSFKSLGKQSGFLFYVPAGYTSKIDPVTGFVNLLPMTNLTNTQKKKAFFEKFIDIHFDDDTKSFAFSFDYTDFEGKAKNELPKTKWTVYSKGKRIVYSAKNKTSSDEYPTERLKALFEKYCIDFKDGKNILSEILKQDDVKFFDELYFAFKWTMQMRNSSAKTDEDYIISPVRAKDGAFFDSREQEKIAERGETPKLPQDADANGAYHIALKGLLLLNRFDKAENLKDGSLLTISNKDWFEFRAKK